MSTALLSPPSHQLSSISHSQNGSQPVALGEMNVPQLTEAFQILHGIQGKYDKLSGICATMKGLVLAEVKHKIDHGQWLPWLAVHYGKTRKTAAEDMRLAAAFCKSNPKVTFSALSQDLTSTIRELEQAQIDLRHPLVRQIAGWVEERSRYQLLLDFPGQTGGSAGRKKLTPAEEHAQFLQDAHDDFTSTLTSLDGLVEDGRWKAPNITDPPTITDAMLEQSVELAREFARQATAWLKLPKKERIFNTEIAEGAKL